jgi:hypothetical protein
VVLKNIVSNKDWCLKSITYILINFRCRVAFRNPFWK